MSHPRKRIRLAEDYLAAHARPDRTPDAIAVAVFEAFTTRGIQDIAALLPELERRAHETHRRRIPDKKRAEAANRLVTETIAELRKITQRTL